MKKLFLASAALLSFTASSVTALASGTQGVAPPKTQLAQRKGGRVDYGDNCKADKLENCLSNDITLYGANVVLVNLDNRCQVEKFEREGIFLQTGDLLFVTGRENRCAW